MMGLRDRLEESSRRRMLQAIGGTSLGLLLAGNAQTQAGTCGCGRGQEMTGSAAPPGGLLADLMSAQALDARNFGARFDGTADDAPALQRAIDAAHEQRRALRLPGGTANLGQPLVLKGRDVSLIGEGMTSTVLRAGRPMAVLIDVEEPGDRIVSPFALMRLTIDGARMTERNLAVCYRHHSWLFEVNSIDADTGFWERDCWLARRYGCRTGDCRIGWHLVGSNHSSIWEACTIAACREMHLAIGNQGSAPDGNASLVFRNCDIEFGEGHGIDVTQGANALFDGCYLGETLGGDTLRNRGFVLVRGGSFFFGGGTGVGIRPLAGVASLEQVSINAQAGGIATLVNLTPSEAGAAGGHGQVRIVEANANLPVGGDPLLQGDPLARVPMTVFAPRLGRDWEGWAADAAIREERAPRSLPEGRLVTCTRASPQGGVFGLRAQLTENRWRESVPIFLACVYRSSAPVQLQLRTPDGALQPLAIMPASSTRATYIHVSTALSADFFSHIELAIPAVAGTAFGLQELTLSDGTNVFSPSGKLRMLALAQ